MAFQVPQTNLENQSKKNFVNGLTKCRATLAIKSYLKLIQRNLGERVLKMINFCDKHELISVVKE